MTNPQPQASPTAIPLTVAAQYLKDLSFENPNAPQIFAPNASQPQLNIGVNVQTRPMGDNAYDVQLIIKAEAKIENKTAFIVEMTYGGVFNMPPLPEEQARYILLVEAPRLLFPFARSILADAVRDGGFPPLLIAPIDFAGLYQNQNVQMDRPPEGTA